MVPPGLSGSAYAGWSVAVSSVDIMVVGAYAESTGPAAAGAAYVYALDPSGGGSAAFLATLTAPSRTANDEFGTVQGQWGGGGPPYFYGWSFNCRSRCRWFFAPQSSHTHTDTRTHTHAHTHTHTRTHTGYALALSVDGVLLVGARYDDAASPDAGAVYLFTTNATAGTVAYAATVAPADGRRLWGVHHGGI